jgi:hypothetical protein
MGTQDEELVRQALDAVLAKAPAPLVDLRYRLDVDFGGDAAVYVTAVVADRPVAGELYDWAELAPINDLVWDEFVSRGIERIPHVSFRQEHEPNLELDLLADASAP